MLSSFAFQRIEYNNIIKVLAARTGDSLHFVTKTAEHTDETDPSGRGVSVKESQSMTIMKEYSNVSRNSMRN